MDMAMAAELVQLAAAKQAAVAAEDYDEAKRLKGAEERLRAVGARMAALEARCVLQGLGEPPCLLAGASCCMSDPTLLQALGLVCAARHVNRCTCSVAVGACQVAVLFKYNARP